MDVVDRSGDVTSTLNDRLMEKASDIRASALEVQEALLGRSRSSVQAAIQQPGRSFSMRCSAISCQLGLMKMISETSLEKMPSPSLFRFGLAEDGPIPIYTSKSKYAALILSLGNLSRGRKRTGPSAYSGLIDYDSTGESRGALVKSIAQSKSHLFMLCEAAGISKDELDFIYSRGWQTIQSISGDILIGSRTNLVGSSLKRLAGSTLVGVAHSHLPLTYMIVEISWGDCACWKSRDSGRALTASASACSTLKTRLLCLGTMFADCLHYQVDLIGGDPNMALHRAMQRNQEGMDIRGEPPRLLPRSVV